MTTCKLIIQLGAEDELGWTSMTEEGKCDETTRCLQFIPLAQIGRHVMKWVYYSFLIYFYVSDKGRTSSGHSGHSGQGLYIDQGFEVFCA